MNTVISGKHPTTLALLLTAALAVSTEVSAATITIAAGVVNEDLPPGAPDTVCSLQEAIRAVNNQSPYGDCAFTPDGQPDRIVIPAGTYETNREMTATRSVVIEGAANGGTVLSTGGTWGFSIRGNAFDDPLTAMTLRDVVIRKNEQTLPVIGLFVENADLSLERVHISGFNQDGLLIRSALFVGSVEISDSVIEDNQGSGIDNAGAGVQVVRTTISGNDDGGIRHDGRDTLGSTSTLNLSVDYSLIADNVTALDGGGIYSIGAQPFLSNTTLSGNRGRRGGGMFHEGLETHLFFVTATGNVAEETGGGAYLDPGSQSVLHFSIFADNDVESDGTAPDLYVGSTIAATYDLIGDPEGTELLFDAGNNQIGVADPGLSPVLADFGGPTLVHALLPGSPALDKIPRSDFSGSVDQRGFARPWPSDGDGDIGAYEFSFDGWVFGFESLDWTSPAPLSLNSQRKTQGLAGLNVGGSGYRVVTGPALTSLASASSTMKLDVFVPGQQPNPWWLGAVQAYGTCPSANLYNVYLGQTELTGKPTGAFATATFSVPSYLVTAFRASGAGCFVSIAVNTNATPESPVLDNLRFVAP